MTPVRAAARSKPAVRRNAAQTRTGVAITRGFPVALFLPTTALQPMLTHPCRTRSPAWLCPCVLCVLLILRRHHIAIQLTHLCRTQSLVWLCSCVLCVLHTPPPRPAHASVSLSDPCVAVRLSPCRGEPLLCVLDDPCCCLRCFSCIRVRLRTLCGCAL